MFWKCELNQMVVNIISVLLESKIQLLCWLVTCIFSIKSLHFLLNCWFWSHCCIEFGNYMHFCFWYFFYLQFSTHSLFFMFLPTLPFWVLHSLFLSFLSCARLSPFWYIFYKILRVWISYEYAQHSLKLLIHDFFFF